MPPHAVEIVSHARQLLLCSQPSCALVLSVLREVVRVAMPAPRPCEAGRPPIVFNVRRMNILAYPCVAELPVSHSALRRRLKCRACGAGSPSRSRESVVTVSRCVPQEHEGSPSARGAASRTTASDLAGASKARKEYFVLYIRHFGLLQM